MLKRMWDHYVKSKRLRAAKQSLMKQGKSSDTSDEDKYKQMKEEADEVIGEYDRMILRFRRTPMENWLHFD